MWSKEASLTVRCTVVEDQQQKQRYRSGIFTRPPGFPTGSRPHRSYLLSFL